VRISFDFSKYVVAIIFAFALSACEMNTSIRDTYADKTAPETPASLSWLQAALTNSNSLTANWVVSVSKDLTFQKVQLYLGSDCSIAVGAPVTYSNAITASHVFSGLADGRYTYKVFSIDHKNNSSESKCSSFVDVDHTAPVVTIDSTVSKWINQGSQLAYSVSGTCFDSGSGVNTSVTVKLSQGASNFLTLTTPCTGGTFSTPMDLTRPTSGSFSDGTNLSLTATVGDRAGNTGTSAARAVSLDTFGPVIQITNAPTWINNANKSTYTVSGNCLESGSGFAGNVTVKIVGLGVTVTGSGACNSATYSATIDASSISDGGGISVLAYASDVAGNGGMSGTITRVKDTLAPVLTIVSPVNQAFLKGNTSVPVNFTLTEINANNTQTMSFAYNNGTSTTNSTVAVTNGPLDNASFSKTITTPNSSNTSISVTIGYTDLAGNPATAVTANYNTDLGAPTVTLLSLNGGVVNTDNNNVSVSLSATNQYSPVTQFCLKYNNATAPSASDSCWVNVNSPSPGITPSTSISFNNYFYQVGFVKDTYIVYAWAKNEAGLISTLSSSGVGTTNTDKFTVDYDPGSPPIISKLEVTNTDAPPSPVTKNELQATSGSYIYVKWNAFDIDGFAANPISVYYTTDGSTYTPFSGASALPNAQGANCSIDGTFSGCARLAAPTSSYFRVRVVATDTRGTTVFYNSEPLNNSNLRILAGNTESGLNGSAKTAVFKAIGQAAANSYVYQNRLAVSSDGKYFYLDPTYGLGWINPANGILSVFIPTTNTSSTDNVDGSSVVSNATLKYPLGIAMDYQDNLLIYDFDRIRKVNISTMKITTMIGGGSTELSSMTTTVNALNAVKLTSSFVFQNITMTMIPMPNGDLLFSSPNANQSNFIDWKYIASTKQVEPMLYTDPDNAGMGDVSTYSWNTGGGSTIRKVGFAVEFNPSTSVVTALIKGFHKTFTGDSYPLYARIDYANGSSASGYPSMGLNNLGALNARGITTGLDGKIYIASRVRTTLHQYDVTSNNPQTILGTASVPSAPCAEYTLATSCAVDIESYFVSSTGRVYFMDQGTLRTINDAKQVITLFGQFPSYNGSGVVPVANARFGMIMDLKLDRSVASNNNRVVILDSYSGNYREIVRNGNASQLTKAEYQWHGPNKFELDPTAGDIFSPNSGGYIRRYSKSSNAWTNVVGGGTYPYATTGDGKNGSDILFSWYNVSLVGYVNNQLFYNKYQWSGTDSINCMVKKYDTSNNYLQSHFLGNSTCDNAWQVGASTSSTGTSISTNVSRVEYYQAGSKYLILRNGNSIYTIDGSNNLQLFATLNHSTNAFTHVVDSSNVLQIYYCSGGYQIFKYTPSTNTTTELPLGPPGMVCLQHSSLNYISSSNSIVFGFAENGLYGVAEYSL
jgi:hypothetical protein